MSNHPSLSDSELVQCQFFLQNHPLFANLDHQAIVELSKLFVVCKFETDDVLVLEDAPVDSIFFIQSGFAMVGRSFSRISSIYIAELKPGNAIGLSETGLFSKTMRRTATVVAKSDVTTFCLDLKKFNQFLNLQPVTNKIIHDNSSLFTRVKFINEIAELKHLSLNSLSLIDKIEEVKLAPNHFLTQNGDWYFLKSGKLEVLLKENENASQIAILSPPALILEKITHKPNVIIKTLEECSLLKIAESVVVDTNEEANNSEDSKELFQYTRDGWVAF